MVKDIVCGLSMGADALSKRGLASVLEIDRSSVKKEISHRALLDITQNAFWLYYRRT